jgi:Predicted membrane protein
MKVTKKRRQALVFVFILYTMAFTAAVVTFNHYYSSGILFASFAADIAATLVVWFFGVITRNSSLYDPYWSVAPIVIIPCWLQLKENPVTAMDMLFLMAVLFWGVRLTYNWASGWLGMEHQDWRYTILKKRTGNLWFIVNLFGINLMPTVLVFLAMLPAYYGIFEDGCISIKPLSFLGFIVCITAALIQYYADKQIADFRKAAHNKGKCIEEGLWKYSRHPNYFGEISFWFGIWLIQVGKAPSLWKTIIGPVLIALLFVFISIPLMEEHVITTRPDYADYKKKVPMAVPWRFRGA